MVPTKQMSARSADVYAKSDLADVASRIADLQKKLDSYTKSQMVVSRKPNLRLRVTCPKCHKREGRRVNRHSFVEECFRAFRISPWHCAYCKHRFYCLGQRNGLKTSATAM